MLKLDHVFTLPIPPQLVGNCSWANVEAAVPTLLYILKEFKEHKPEHNLNESVQFFNAWLKWDKEIALDDCIKSFHDAKEETRKSSKAGILAAILFQTIKYEDQKSMRIAEKILKVLTLKKYRYILDSYLDVYVKDGSDKEGENLKEILEELGINYH